MSTTLTLEPTRDGQQAVIEASFAIYVVLVVVFILIGVPLVLIGLLVTLGEGATGEDFGLGLILGAVGLFLTGAALLILIRPAQPKRMVFDNDLAVLELVERGKNASKGAFRLPYAEIEGFRVVRHVSTSSRSGSGRSVSYRWHVVMDKRDGAAWTLLIESKEGDAHRALEQLTTHVDLACAPGREERGQGSVFFTVRRQSGGVVVTWTPPRRLLRAIAGLAVVGAMSAGAAGWYTMSGGFAPLVIGAIAGLFVLLVLIGAVGSFIRPPSVEITREHMSCSAGGLFLPRKWTAPLTDIHTITFHFAPHEVSSHLLALSAAQASQLAGMVQGPASVGDAMTLLNIMMKAHKIDITSLSTGQALELETLLQDQIQAVTGEKVA